MQLSLSPAMDTGSGSRPSKRSPRQQPNQPPQWAIEIAPGSGQLLTMADAPKPYACNVDPRPTHVLLFGKRAYARTIAEYLRQENIHPRAHSVRVAATVRITGKG